MTVKMRNTVCAFESSYFVFSKVCFADRYFAAQKMPTGVNRL